MTLSIISYAVFIALLPLGYYLTYRPIDPRAGRLAFAMCEFLGFSALWFGLGYDNASGGALDAAAVFLRLSRAFGVIGFVTGVRLAAGFPDRAIPRPLNALFVLAAAVAAYFILLGQDYLKTVELVEGRIRLDGGDLFEAASFAGLGLAALAGLVLSLRGLGFKDRIYRLQASFITVSIVGGALIAFAFAYYLPRLAGVYGLEPLSSLGYLLLVLGMSYGYGISRAIDLRAVLNRVLVFVAFGLLYGLVAGVLVTLLLLLGLPPLIFTFVSATAFILIALMRRFLVRVFQRQLAARTGYLDKLEKDLMALDYSSGRDLVIEAFTGIMKQRVGCNSVSIMLENAQDELEVVDVEGHGAKMPRHNAAVEHLLNMDATVVFRTEALADHDYSDIREALLDIFKLLDAEVLMLLHEGRHVIGFVGLGAKEGGSDYTSYDSEALGKVYGKVFVVGYYLKNIAREHLITTVDRELEFSNQIIQSIQENIDQIRHPKVDAFYLNKSTHKLGGDFIDVVRLNQDRYFFVLGDVSGKGLNASMSMVILKSIIRTFLKETPDFKLLVTKVNSFIKNHLPRGTFFAGVFGLFDFSKSSFFYVNCGIPVMMLYSPTYNNIIEIQGEGKVLGFAKDVTDLLGVKKVSFAPDSVLLTTTDGLLESENLRGEHYGKERLERVLQSNKELTSERLVRTIYQSLEEFISQEIGDDVTVFALKALAN
jgi:hypothetical protein